MLATALRHRALAWSPPQFPIAKEPALKGVQRGIVAEPPAGGRSVKVDGGYMVPYTETNSRH